MLRGILSGAGSILRAVSFLWRERSLWMLCAAPLATTVLVLGLAVYAYFGFALEPLSAWLGGFLAVADPAAWYGWLWVAPLRALGWALQWLLALVFFALIYVVFVALGSVLASPFLDALSLRVERLERGYVPESSAGIGGLLWSMGQEARRAAFLLGGGLTLAMVGLIPGGQVPAVAGALLFGAFFLPLEYTGFVLDRRSVDFAHRRAWLWRHRWHMLGFGGAALVTYTLPIVNFLCLPILVTAGTRLALELGPPRDACGTPPIRD